MLIDLKPDNDNKLSLYLILDDFSNLTRVVTAFAATRDDIAPFDYGLLELKN